MRARCVFSPGLDINRLPMASEASASGKSWPAGALEMMATITAPARSSAVKPHPRRSGMPIVLRYPSPTRVTWAETDSGATFASICSDTLITRYRKSSGRAVGNRDGRHTTRLRECRAGRQTAVDAHPFAAPVDTNAVISEKMRVPFDRSEELCVLFAEMTCEWIRCDADHDETNIICDDVFTSPKPEGRLRFLPWPTRLSKRQYRRRAG